MEEEEEEENEEYKGKTDSNSPTRPNETVWCVVVDCGGGLMWRVTDMWWW